MYIYPDPVALGIRRAFISRCDPPTIPQLRAHMGDVLYSHTETGRDRQEMSCFSLGHSGGPRMPDWREAGGGVRAESSSLPSPVRNACPAMELSSVPEQIVSYSHA